MATLELLQIYKSFGTVEVIHDMNLSVSDGELIVFVGPSGCGKSTLLRMIAGLEKTTSGEIKIGGKQVNHLPPAQRGIAMVFQSYALYPHKDVRGNLGFALKHAGVPKKEINQRVDNAAEILGLSDLMTRRPRELSGGQRQRVAIGRAIVREPDVFLFDEPLSNLDAALRVHMRVEILKLHQRLGSTMIYVTHDQTEAMTLADRIVVFREGVVEQIGTPLELYRQPENIFVAGFIGSPAMNFLDTTIVDGFIHLAGTKICAAPESQSAKTLGCRPEHFTLSDHGLVAGEVQVSENMGGESIVHLNLSDKQIMVVKLTGEHSFRTGDVCKLNIDPKQCHLFNQAGHRI